MPQPLWQAAEQSFSLELRQLAGMVNVLRPDEGLSHMVVGGKWQVPGHALAVSSLVSYGEEPLQVDAYERGNDLIATYAETDHRPLRIQTYWRGVTDSGLAEEIAAVDLQLSVQTHLLDSRPLLCTRSTLPADEILYLTNPDKPEFSPLPAADFKLTGGGCPACLLLRTSATEYNYVEMIHPDDLAEVSVHCGQGDELVEIVSSLFSGSLEKGVLLRGRLRGAFIPRERDTEFAWRCYRHLLDTDLPLTV